MNKLTTHLQHPNVQATDCLLRLLQVPVHSFTVEQQLEEHPDWPSLLCISDALHQWHIPHLAAKAADQQLPDTHYPLLAVTNHPERPLAVVVGVHNDVVHFYQYSYRQQHQEPLKDFLQRWTGIYLIAEATPQSGDPEYAAAARKRRWQLALPITALLLALTALGGLCWPRLQHLTGSANLSGGGATIAAIIAIFILYLAGLAVSLMLLWYDIDKRNPLLQKVCTGLVKTNCNAILNSSASKLFGWLSWSEIGFAYYAGGLLLMAFPTQAPWALQWLGLVGVAALVYPIFSIYYQWRIAKQWCMLCLAVQAVLVLQGTALWMGNYLPALSLDTLTTFLIPQSAFIIATVYILPLLAWLFLKPWLLRHQTALREQRAYRRLKFNPEVFTSLLHKQKAIATPTNGLGIVLGPANAPHKLVKVCNPYCGPCSKAHPKIEQLLHRHPNLQVQILFMVPNVPGEKYHTAASHLMAIAHTAAGQAQVQQALDDWYLPETKDYEAFATKYPLNGAVAAAAPTITAMEQWSKANDIRYTPTLFYNGYELPPEYDLEDLPYFLQE